MPLCRWANMLRVCIIILYVNSTTEETWWSLQLGVGEKKYIYIRIGQMSCKISAYRILAKNRISCIPTFWYQCRHRPPKSYTCWALVQLCHTLWWQRFEAWFNFPSTDTWHICLWIQQTALCSFVIPSLTLRWLEHSSRVSPQHSSHLQPCPASSVHSPLTVGQYTICQRTLHMDRGHQLLCNCTPLLLLLLHHFLALESSRAACPNSCERREMWPPGPQWWALIHGALTH